MSITLDGFKVLRRLGENADAFAPVRVDADKTARGLVVKCLKAKTTGIDGVRAIHQALHDKQFELIVEGLKDAEVKSLLTKIDKHHPELKTQNAQWRRRHLIALTSGAAEPSAPSVKAKKSKSTQKSGTSSSKKPEPRRLQSDVMDLFRARGKGD
jgi:uncharacterized protein (DUF4415 family)